MPNVDKKESQIKKDPIRQPIQNTTNRRETYYQDRPNNMSTRVIKSGRSSFSDDSTRGRGITRSRGWRGSGRPTTDTRRKNLPSNQDNEQDYIMSQNFINKNMSTQQSTQMPMEELERGISNINVRENIPSNRGGHNRSVNNVPPRLQSQESQRQGAPKRYSSLRQRSLPETSVAVPNGPPPQQVPPVTAPTFAPHHPPPPTIIHFTPHTG